MPADIREALGLLTVVPAGEPKHGAPVAYFTVIGWLFAGTGVGVISAAAALDRSHGLDALVVAALVVLAWGALSGFLHWDGLADAADGLGVRGDASRRLAVMRDSTVGAFGVTAIVFVALLQVLAMAVVIDSGSWWALGAPVFGRLGAALALWFRAPASEHGLAARYATRPGAVRLALLLLPVVPLLAVPFPLSPVRVVASLAGISFAVLVPGIFARRLGGVNGDVLGAVIVLTETFVLLLGALLGGAL